MQTVSERLEEAEKKTETETEIKERLIALIERYKAGSPTDSNTYWISLKPYAIVKLFEEEHNTKISNRFVKRLLKELGYGYRKQSKQLSTGSYTRRNEQFEIICALVLIMSVKSPVLSIDCKKKEKLGNLYRNGKCFCTKSMKVFDHDYEHLSESKVIPHGIYDMHANKGYISIGNHSETADFVVDNLLWWWWEYGIHQYPDAKNILLLCDAGGANSYRHLIFKHRLMHFAKQTGLSVIVCHYPPYCSKWNPIEHRLFSHVHRAMEGIIFSDYQTVQKIIENTSTKTGLTVLVRLNLKEYQKGLRIEKDMIDEKRISY
ncbi:MAG: ISAzo13 family transposase, partial [Bacteroidetes bacterium]|nr:ISAzo13 family transposase [Bacteroidota bacterium]